MSDTKRTETIRKNKMRAKARSKKSQKNSVGSTRTEAELFGSVLAEPAAQSK